MLDETLPVYCSDGQKLFTIDQNFDFQGQFGIQSLL